MRAEKFEQVEEFKYYGNVMKGKGRVEKEIMNKVVEGMMKVMDVFVCYHSSLVKFY